MSDYYPVVYQMPAAQNTCTALIRLAVAGAMAGGSVAAGNNIRRVRNNDIETHQALISTGRSALSGAVVAATGGAAASIVEEQGLLRLGVMFAAGTTAMYLLESLQAGNPEEKMSEATGTGRRAPPRPAPDRPETNKGGKTP
jgi:hypothetical protein